MKDYELIVRELIAVEGETEEIIFNKRIEVLKKHGIETTASINTVKFTNF